MLIAFGAFEADEVCPWGSEDGRNYVGVQKSNAWVRNSYPIMGRRGAKIDFFGFADFLLSPRLLDDESGKRCCLRMLFLWGPAKRLTNALLADVRLPHNTFNGPNFWRLIHSVLFLLYLDSYIFGTSTFLVKNRAGNAQICYAQSKGNRSEEFRPVCEETAIF